VNSLPFDGILHMQLRNSRCNKLSLEEYGGLIGRTGRQVSRYECCHHGISNKDHQFPTVNPLKNMCLTLQVDPKKLIGVEWVDSQLIGKINKENDFLQKISFCKHCGSAHFK
jgi:hypothetical protein